MPGEDPEKIRLRLKQILEGEGFDLQRFLMQTETILHHYLRHFPIPIIKLIWRTAQYRQLLDHLEDMQSAHAQHVLGCFEVCLITLQECDWAPPLRGTWQDLAMRVAHRLG